jgi:hypothetical protein
MEATDTGENLRLFNKPHGPKAQETLHLILSCEKFIFHICYVIALFISKSDISLRICIVALGTSS